MMIETTTLHNKQYRTYLDMNVQVEVQDDHLMIILPHQKHSVVTAWEDAWELGAVIEKAALEVPQQSIIIDLHELDMIRINVIRKKFIVLVFQGCSRIKLSPQAAITLGRRIRVAAQNLQLTNAN